MRYCGSNDACTVGTQSFQLSATTRPADRRCASKSLMSVRSRSHDSPSTAGGVERRLAGRVERPVGGGDQTERLLAERHGQARLLRAVPGPPPVPAPRAARSDGCRHRPRAGRGRSRTAPGRCRAPVRSPRPGAWHRRWPDRPPPRRRRPAAARRRRRVARRRRAAPPARAPPIAPSPAPARGGAGEERLRLRLHDVAAETALAVEHGHDDGAVHGRPHCRARLRPAAPPRSSPRSPPAPRSDWRRWRAAPRRRRTRPRGRTMGGCAAAGRRDGCADASHAPRRAEAAPAPGRRA